MRFRYTFFVGLLVLLTDASGVSAQPATDSVAVKPGPIKLRPTYAVLKLAPLTLLDIDPAWQAGLELRTIPSVSVQGEIAYGPANWAGPFPNLNLLGADYLQDGWSHQPSWRYRGELRYYLPFRFLQTIFKPKRQLNGVYIAAEYLHKDIGINKTTSSASGGLITSLDYSQKINRTTRAGHLKIGLQLALSHQKTSFLSRVFIDVYAGAGRRYVNITQTAGPSVLTANGRIPEALRYTRFIPGLEGWLPGIAGGLKIGVAL
ncbi:hypothetical protein [Arsenicibacter rosenii]|uniref:Outer membrane protein beta-barrel domain-containing protein n=1 Tax=Arsenicibacter rosenii TaxID=1750698 RepID=A0A1S2VLB4_9BACT|nr:hypothetical protein [Arsenicibacter rosenii]OIN59552.1 hypothetical protein BLX24_06660 [Arsenicibacter rosenii]